MTYIENVFICISVPLLLSLLFVKGTQRRYTLFLCIGMGICMVSAYVNSFFMELYQVDGVTAAIEISPVCEEILKLVPLLFFLLIFEPKPKEITPAAISIAVGFATFENVCYLSENGAGNFTFLLIRGLSAGAIHILCGIAVGYGNNLFGTNDPVTREQLAAFFYRYAEYKGYDTEITGSLDRFAD